MLQAENKLIYQYLYETLGIHYLPQVIPAEPAQQNHVIWQSPAATPEVIFFNLDPATDITNPSTQELFKKITQAMNLDFNKIWYADSQGRSFMDFLNWLKNQNLVAPLVVMKSDPDIQNHIQNAGRFNWVECFSLQSMLTQTSLKKPTWEVLKMFLEKKS